MLFYIFLEIKDDKIEPEAKNKKIVIYRNLTEYNI